MENDFGEDISDEKVSEIIERILKLSDNLIDELFYRCHLIYHVKRKSKFKALNDELLDEIKEEEHGNTTLITLLTETHIKDILTNLKKIEEENLDKK